MGLVAYNHRDPVVDQYKLLELQWFYNHRLPCTRYRLTLQPDAASLGRHRQRKPEEF